MVGCVVIVAKARDCSHCTLAKAPNTTLLSRAIKTACALHAVDAGPFRLAPANCCTSGCQVEEVETTPRLHPDRDDPVQSMEGKPAATGHTDSPVGCRKSCLPTGSGARVHKAALQTCASDSRRRYLRTWMKEPLVSITKALPIVPEGRRRYGRVAIACVVGKYRGAGRPRHRGGPLQTRHDSPAEPPGLPQAAAAGSKRLDADENNRPGAALRTYPQHKAISS